MILEKYGDPQADGYADLIIADYHQEYPLKTARRLSPRTRVQLLWDPFAMDGLREFLRGRHGLTWDETKNDPAPFEAILDDLLPNLEQKYNGHYEHGMALWLLHGNVTDLGHIFYSHALAVADPPSGDDSTFDYWPNALDMLIVFAHDLYELTNDRQYYNRVKEVFAVVEAALGPAVEWEADQLKREVEAL